MNAGSASPDLDAASLLRLLWLASPALPVGGFSYSEGLEALVTQSPQAGEREVAAWIADHLHLTQARSDWPVLAAAIGAWRACDLPRIAALNAWVLATRETSELRLQTEQMGKSFTDWLRNLGSAAPARPGAADHPGAADPAPAIDATDSIDALAALAPPSYPVAFALAVAQSGASVRSGVLAYGFGWAENLVQAAIKAVPLGQNAGQRILAALAAELPAAVDGALALPDAGRQSFAPLLAIRSAQHEVQYSRLFRS